MTKLILASASPARLATLQRAGVEPIVRVSGVDERAVTRTATERFGEVLSPGDTALLLAQAKAEAVARELDAPANDSGGGLDNGGGLDDAGLDDDGLSDSLLDDAVVVGCDSILEMDGKPYGRPADAATAIARIKAMSGNSGTLHTGHWVIDLRSAENGGTGATLGATGSTIVHFSDIEDEEIEAYVATGEPLQVAGSFTVDGLGGPFVAGIEGDYHNVVGISLPLLRDILRQIGVPWHTLRS
ncbi:MAG: Maf family nucleotide pyrophosphatase [Cellulomonadaceae bacterium]|jgi:septum formation protein|nr:Maf family nucleotide pyrophosphatase [Cellulomonadaceae bacterium]